MTVTQYIDNIVNEDGINIQVKARPLDIGFFGLAVFFAMLLALFIHSSATK